MGNKDDYQYDYLDDNERFADQINGALFEGVQVVKAEELEPVDAQDVYLGREAGQRKNYKTVSDKVRMWRGGLLHILSLQNQTYADYRMVLRNMLSESIGYHKQWKQKKAAHEKAGDLEPGTDAFFSGMEKDEKFIPIITLVVYCGTEHGWDGARSLHDLLAVDDRLKRYVSNYTLNLYDCHAHDTFTEYHTGLRQLYEVVRYGRDKEKLRKLIEDNAEAYSSIDRDTREMIEVMANVKIPETYGHTMEEDGRKERRYNMCKAFEDYRLEGVEEGLEKGKAEGRLEGRTVHLIELICKKLQKNKEAELIAEELEEELPVVEQVIEAQKSVGSYDIEQIFRALSLSQAPA